VPLDLAATVEIAIVGTMGAVTVAVASLEARKLRQSSTTKRRPTIVARSSEDERVQKKVDSLRKKDPKAFYYLDEKQVEDLHSQIEQRHLARVEQTRTSEGAKSIGARSAVLEGSYHRGSREETKEVFELRQQRASMYNQVENHLIDRKKLIWGIEDFEWDKSKIDEFDKLRSQIMEKCEFEIPEHVTTSFVTKTMGEFAKAKMHELANSIGYVAMVPLSSEFSVVSVDNDIYKLELEHPLSNHLPSGEPKVRIAVKCPKSYVTLLGQNTFQKGRSLKLVCIGNVVSWNEVERVLELNPIALY
jgi:hypothetical protein